ncbi:trypsin-1-like isoform X2 [Anticarsia gemmatalis]|uniref:trypsin-1-like isoform X2 n=1 Tax=Anticarsia gemmatalis TaxID=129554 RepID=UPI003F75FD16
MKSIKIIVIIITLATAKHDYKSHHHSYLARLLKTKENFYSKTNERVQSTMNKMFHSMDLSPWFPDKPKVKLLLTMHYDLNKMVERNYEVHNILRNITAVKANNKRLDEMIKEVLDDKQFNVYKSKTNKKPLPPSSEVTTDLGTRRIFGGTSTKFDKFPFIVSIHIMKEFTCAGSIISRNLVLTAASCMQVYYNNIFFKEDQKTTYVLLASDWPSKLGEIVPIAEIYFNPAYDPRSLHHNLAIIRLQRSIRFEQGPRAKLKRIELDRGENVTIVANHVTMLGWGSKMPNQIWRNISELTAASLDVYPLDECKQVYTKDFVTDKNFCAGFVAKGTGACNRDDGGPGIVGGLLVGVVSFGSPVCGAKDAPTVFTQVKFYFDWIQSIIDMEPVEATPLMISTAKLNQTFEEQPLWPRATNPIEDNELQVLNDILYGNDNILTDIINDDLLFDFNVDLMRAYNSIEKYRNENISILL